MTRLNFLCNVDMSDQVLIGSIVAVGALICGAVARGLLSLIWRNRAVEHTSFSGFRLGCLFPFGAVVGLSLLVSKVVPGVEQCQSTEVISYPVLSFLVASPLVFLSYVVVGKVKFRS